MASGSPSQPKPRRAPSHLEPFAHPPLPEQPSGHAHALALCHRGRGLSHVYSSRLAALPPRLRQPRRAAAAALSLHDSLVLLFFGEDSHGLAHGLYCNTSRYLNVCNITKLTRSNVQSSPS